MLVEDDATIREMTQLSLERDGFVVDTAADGPAGLDAFRAGSPDLVLLDVMLPGLDGVSVCRAIRESSVVPVVMLTARTDEMDVVVGLEAGADDYLTKPFRFGELLARVRAHLRRQAVVPPSQEHLAVGRLRLDAAARRVTVDDVEVSLRTKEFELLARLAADAGHAVSREALMADVWDAHWYGSTKTLDVTIGRLRQKLESVGVQEKVVAVRGVGFRIEGATADA